MPGIFGIVDVDYKRNISNLLKMMTKMFVVENWHGVDTFANNNIGLGRVYLETTYSEKQPIWNENKSMCIIMDGKIYDFAIEPLELIKKKHKIKIGNDAEYVLHLFEEFGEQCINKLNGSFVFAIWDNVKRSLIIANDRYGSRPLYYIETAGTLFFGPMGNPLIKASRIRREINDATFADFFTFGFPLGEKTFFKSLELLPAASILNWRNGNLTSTKYWDFDFNEDYSPHLISEYIDEFVFLMKQAVNRVLKKYNRYAFLHSGGLDTRTVLSVVEKDLYPIYTLTFGIPGCDDQKIARSVANKLGTQHSFVEIPPGYIKEDSQKTVFLTEGMCSVNFLRSAQIWGQLFTKFDALIGGMMGGELFGQYQLPPNVYTSIKDKGNFLNRLFYKWRVFHDNEKLLLFTPKYYKFIKETARDSFMNSIDGALDKKPFNITDYFNFTQVLKNFATYGLVVSRNWIEYAVPFYDYDLVDFALKIPPQLRAKEKLRIEVIKHKFPELAKFPWEHTGLPLKDSLIAMLKYRMMKKTIKMFDKTIRKLSKGKHSLKPAYLAEHDKWMRTVSADFVKKVLLDIKTLNRPYFNGEYIKKLVHSHMNGKNNAYRLGVLLTFELFNRLFIDGDEL
jgi:asparagine synthase (glutamine-hydrolysing)